MKNLYRPGPCGWWRAGLCLAGLALLAGCRGGTAETAERSPDVELPAGGIAVQPLQPGRAGDGFTRLPAAHTGLDFVNELQPHNMRKYLLNGAGLATGDYDNDGRVDVYAVSQDGGNRLFRQTADWQFEDVTELAGDLSGGSWWGSGASFADLNNDGWLDLYVCNINGPNQLFVNLQDGTFEEQAGRRQADFPGATTMASVADYDRDGDLDIYLVNNRVFSILEEQPEIKLRKANGRNEVHPDFVEQYFLLDGRVQEAGQQDRLLRNDGSGNFSDATSESGIEGHYDMGLSATWWDFDHDGWLDLYVANDLKSPDHLYRNRGDGTFEDVLAGAVGHTPWFSMGADAADVNNDGRVDLLVVDMSSTTHYKQKTTMGEMGNSAWFLTWGRPRQFMRNALFVNSGSPRFLEAANLAGLDSTDWSWSVRLADLDSDGQVDVFVTNGVGRNMNDSDAAAEYRELVAAGRRAEAERQLLSMPPLEEANLAFRNRGDLQFADVSADWGLDLSGVSQGASLADIDRDGDLDLLVGNMNSPLAVYRNDLDAGHNLLVRLVGTASNRFGIGATITVTAGDQQQVRTLTLARGYMSADEPLAHFGLGRHSRVQRLDVDWPSGIRQSFHDLDADQLVTITEGSRGSVPPPPPAAADPWLQPVTATDTGIGFRHAEIEQDDFQHQPLLPNKLSQLGPGMAWGDVNGDGRQDVFLGNAASMPPSLLLQEEGGRFRTSGDWVPEASYEDMGAAFLDVDSDGDLDLYVASGGYGLDPDSRWLRDRLYLNDGRGDWSPAPQGTVPDIRASSSCVLPMDYDRDGDPDLFVGTRLVPRQWPLPATSYLLENQDGKLVDVTGSVAPGLVQAGLVSDGAWTDLDNDGWQDLVVACEWGPLRCFRNDGGKLVEITDAAGLGPYQGWWNSVAAADLDRDGDMDLVAGNTGLNSKYHATPEHPVQLFAADFDNNGTLDLVETEWEGDTCFPVRGRSCSSHAMPFLKEKFPTFHEFALADVAEIYTDDALDQASRFVASHLESMVMINDGNGRFEARPLPRMAQISPAFGIQLGDINGDGQADISLAQNFLHPQPETGQMDGGTGLVLAGDGKAGFRPLWPVDSGVNVEGQGMSLARVDLNGDRAPDQLLARNDRQPAAWTNRQAGDDRWMSIRLAGRPGNPEGRGSRVRVHQASGQERVFEIGGGSGYLTQSAAVLYLAEDPTDPVVAIEVRWPDGSETTVEPTGRDILIPADGRQ